MKHKQFLAISVVLLLLVGMLAGCEAKAPSEGYYAADMEVAATYAPMETAPATTGASLNSSTTTQESAAPVNQKLIRTVNLEAETEDMDLLLDAVYQRVTELGGYVENRNIQNGSGKYSGTSRRYASLTIRIPADRLDSFVQHVSDEANIISNRESTEDVTLQYVATESRIIALETEHARLLELLAKAEDMSDLLLIESRLTEVRAELEQVKSQLRLYDNLVSYGTVHLSISEVKEYTVIEEEPETVWERISTGFVRSLTGLWTGITEIFVFLVVALPYLVVFGLLLTALILLIRVRRKKRVRKPIQTDHENNES